MRSMLCRLGRHAWVQKRNAEVGGAEAVYEQCTRCGKERRKYGKPPSTGVAAG
jgi:hypothetical protein